MMPIIMPQVGQDIPSATIIEWRRREGDHVEKGEVVLVVESDKASFEVEADRSGVLLKILHQEGEEVEILRPLAYVGQEGEVVAEEELEQIAPAEAPSEPEREELPARPAVQDERARVFASPSARRLAGERGLELAGIKGTGPGGRITKRDVLAAPVADETVLPFGKMRRRMAERLTLSAQTIPHFYLSVDVDMTEAQQWRLAFNGEHGEQVTVTDMVIKASALSLAEFERINVHVEADRLILKRDVNVGVAVAMDDGLLVPVIAEADRKGLVEVSRISRKNAETARRGAISSQAVGTFTISSLGMCAVSRFLPIINPPECAILAVSSVEQRVVHVAGGIAVRDMMTLTLGCDHRAVDGAYAAGFLNRIKGHLEQPAAMAAETEG